MSQQLYDKLSKLTIKEGLPYIKENNLEQTLKEEVLPKDRLDEKIDLEYLLKIYYNNNIDSDRINLKEIAKRVENEIMGLDALTEIIMMPSTKSLSSKSKSKSLSSKSLSSKSLSSKSLSSKSKSNKNKTPKRVQESINKTRRSKKQYGGSPPYFHSNWSNYTLLTLTYPTGNKTLISATSLPINNGGNLRRLFRFFKEKVGLRMLINLQDCENTTSNRSACKDQGWYKQDSLSEPLSWGENYYSNEIPDFTSGIMTNWHLVNKLPVWQYPTLIHCLAGFGRTGSVLLFYWFRFQTILKNGVNLGFQGLRERFLGRGTSKQMFEYLLNFGGDLSLYSEQQQDNNNIIPAIILNQHADWDPFHTGTTFNPDKIVHEVFHIDNINEANMFVTRINYIILFTAYFCQALDKAKPGKWPGVTGSKDRSTVFFYPLHKTTPDKNNIFLEPIPTNIFQYVENNVFGLKM